MRRWLPPVLAVVIVAGAGGVFVYSRLAEPPPVSATSRPPAVDTVTVRRTNLATSVTVDGTLGFGAPTAFTGRKAGTLTWLPAVGMVVRRGQRLYAVNAAPVPLLFGDTPLYRTLRLGMPPGPDVVELIANLQALGYADPGTGGTFSRGTQAALKRWQRDTGVPATGTLGAGDAVVLPGTVRIDSVTAQPGASATAPLFAYTSTARSVTATLDPTKIDVAVLRPGTTVGLTLPNGAGATGTVRTITSADNGSGDSGGSADPAGSGSSGSGEPPGQVATIAIDGRAADAVSSGPVQVRVTTASRTGVLAVPVTALLALGEGGYALQVVPAKGPTRLVRVATGLFADDLVEVTGDGLAEGMRVVRAS